MSKASGLSEWLSPALLGAGAVGVASASMYAFANAVLGSRAPRTHEEKAEERRWLAAHVGHADAAAVSVDDTAKHCMLRLRMYRHFHRKAYDGLAKALAAIVRARRHHSKNLHKVAKGTAVLTVSRYVAGARRALEDLMAALKDREGDPAENGYDDAAEVAESLSEWLDSEFVNTSLEGERLKGM